MAHAPCRCYGGSLAEHRVYGFVRGDAAWDPSAYKEECGDGGALAYDGERGSGVFVFSGHSLRPY